MTKSGKHPNSSPSTCDGEVAAGTADGGACNAETSPIKRSRTAPPKPEAAPMYLAQSHKGTKKGQPDTPLVILNLFQDLNSGRHAGLA